MTTELFCNSFCQGGYLFCEMLEANKEGLHDVTVPKKIINQACAVHKHKGAVSSRASQWLKTSWVFTNSEPISFSMGISGAQKSAGFLFFVMAKALAWAAMQRLGSCSSTSQKEQNQFQSPAQRTANAEGH